ncbi:uncharacterized protein LOC117338114 [Pecten maximus]|uniref:uncharacterized protein LOC117338114 n=1 Tax=Pecten maximus TaxID=6579 RepID=UPI001458848C|nr:uncharacterized protein LOC117338114 [Pecten maximus]
MVISRPLNMNRKRKPVIASFVDNRKMPLTTSDIAHLKSLSNSPISYLVENGSDTSTVNTPLGPQFIGSALSYHAPLIQPVTQPREVNSDKCGDIAFPKELPSCIDVPAPTPEWGDVSLTQTEAQDIEKSTRSQSDTQLWFTERKKRITASNFGRIMLRKKFINDAFMSTFQERSFTSAPTSYGKANELIAKQMYIKQSGNHIHDIGLVINPKLPFIGATPDAIVCDKMVTGLVEIKCPYSVRDMTIEDACTNSNKFFLEKKWREI